MVVVAYLVVPWVVALVESLGGYDPSYYEPKDQQRQSYLRSLPQESREFFGWESTVKLILLVLVAILWLSALGTSPWRGSRR